MAHKIELKCCCGAEFAMEDSKGSFITIGGKPDEKGRIFLIEKRSDEWQEKHQQCIDNNRIRKTKNGLG